ncbi:MAG: chemotaxis-specific protein-glutamate methyltransferase CheB [Lachnospiraceae bacterium]|nr:chemotaxis-specific protein-glutamate methyltransferase CheB [Lachnospiraceae bacterium]
MEKKKILIVDDSALMRKVLCDIILSDEHFTIIKEACDGLEALNYVLDNLSNIDAIVTDINMPKMSGLEFLEVLEKNRVKIPILLVSSLAKEGAKETVRGLELGAFDFVTKPTSMAETRSNNFKDEVLKKLCYAVKVKVDTIIRSSSPMNPKVANASRRPHKKTPITEKKLVVIVSSTGGPRALQSVITLLPKSLPCPVLLVQHMPEGFTESLAQRLDQLSPINVKEASDGDVLQKGTVYIAKGGSQMRLKKTGQLYTLSVDKNEPARAGLKPCGDILLESLVETDFAEYICVVLTGMGGDGTLGILKLCDCKNVCVLAQDEKTSTVYGMPRVVYEAGLTNEVLPLGEITSAIIKYVEGK